MSGGERALEHIRREVEVFDPALDGSVLVLRRLGLAVGVESIEQTVEPGRVGLRFEITAVHARQLPRGICETVNGFGTSSEDALALATGGWCRNVLPVIAALLGEPSASVRRLELTLQDSEVIGGFGWHLLMGPLETTASERGVDQAELLRDLIEKVRPQLEQPSVHWLRCSLAQLPGRDTDVECRFDNVPWADGELRLRELAREWSSVRTYKLRRQFFLFEPRPLGELRFAGALRAEEAASRARWKFWR